MANTRYTQLPVTPGLDGNEIVPIDQSDGLGGYVTRRTTTGAIAGAAGSFQPTVSFVLASASGFVPQGRVLTGGAGNISITDAGPGADITVDLLATAVAAGSYGGSGRYVHFTVDANGRLTEASDSSDPYDGTVTTVSVVSANGFAGSVATPTTTPALTLSTTVTGILQGDGTSITARTVSGTGNIVLQSGATITNPAAITGVPTPSAAGDAANKAYADSVAAGLSIRQSVSAATAAALAANTYVNGASGVGATLTANANGALAAIDGYSASVNDRILVQNETTGAHNGIYVVTQLGDAGLPYILTRSTDYDTSAEITGGTFTYVIGGSTNNNKQFGLAITGTVTVGTTALVFTQIGIGTVFYTAGSGLALSGSNVFSISAPVSFANGGTNATSRAAARLSLLVPVFVLNITSMRALNPAFDLLAELLGENGGQYAWTLGDYTARIAADTVGGIFVKSNVVSAAIGAYVRQFNGGILPEWFGADNTGVTGASSAINIAVATGIAAYGAAALDFRTGIFKNDGLLSYTTGAVVFRGGTFVRAHDLGPQLKMAGTGAGTGARYGIYGCFFEDPNNVGTVGNSPKEVVFDYVQLTEIKEIEFGEVIGGISLLGCIDVHIADIDIQANQTAAYNAAREGMEFGSTALVSPGHGGNIYWSNIYVNGGAGATPWTASKMSTGLRTTAIDGMWGSKVEVIGTSVADIEFDCSGTDQLTNVDVVQIFADQAKGYGIHITGNNAISQMRLDGRVSMIKNGTAGVPGVYVDNPFSDLTLEMGVEGMLSHGIHINNTSASDLVIRPKVIRNNTGDGIYIQALTGRANITGGVVGGDSTTINGVHIGASAANVSVVGVKAILCTIGVLIDLGATFVYVVGNDLRGNSGSPITDNSGSITKTIKDNSGTIFYGSGTGALGTIGNGVSFNFNVTVTNAAVGYFCTVAFDKDLAGTIVSASVVAANTVKVTGTNVSGGSLTYGLLTAYVQAERRFNS